MKKIIRTFGFLALLGLAHVASAQIIVTVTATANSSAYGYTSPSPYTFIFTSAASFSDNGNNVFDNVGGGRNQWGEESSTDDQMWASVAGTGLSLSGSFVRPSANGSDPYSWISAPVNGTNFDIIAGSDTSNTGLMTLDNTVVKNVVVENVAGGTMPNWTVLSSYADPFNSTTGYFASYFGTYAPGGGQVILETGTGTMLFSVTNVSISAAAVPEPSTYAAALGLAALAFAGWRRRKIAA